MGKRWRRKRRAAHPARLLDGQHAADVADLVDSSAPDGLELEVREVPILPELAELQRKVTARRDAELEDLEPAVRELVERVGAEVVQAETERMIYGRRLVRLDLTALESRVSIARIRRALADEAEANRPRPDVVLVTAAAGSRIDDEARRRDRTLVPPVLKVWGATLERVGEL